MSPDINFWTAIGAIGSIIAGFASFGGILYAVHSFRQESRRSRIALQTESLLTLAERLDSDRMRNWRGVGARKLLSNTPDNLEISYVLDFFSTIASLMESEALDVRLGYREFSWWMIRYWLAASEYVLDVRTIDPENWLTLEKTVSKLLTIGEQEYQKPRSTYTPQVLAQFLEDESRLPVT